MPSRTCNACTTRSPAIRQPRQQGVVTLAMTLLVLFLSSLMVFQSSAGLLFEIRTGNNLVSQFKAMEAARGGVEHALAWLASGAVSSTALSSAGNWSNDGSGPSGNNQQANSSLFGSAVSAQSIGSYSVAVSLWRNAATPNTLEIRATASGDASASIRQKVQLTSTNTSNTSTITTTTPATVNLATVAPIVVHGDLGNCGQKNCITGNPDISASENGDMVVTSEGSVVNTGHFNKKGPAVTEGTFTGSAWDKAFPGITMAQMLAAADYKTIFYYTYDANSKAYSPPLADFKSGLGSSSQPVIIIFDTGSNCPKLNGGTTIYGIVYFAGDCTKNNGWGGSTIIGSLVTESDLNVLTANTNFVGWTKQTGTSTISVPITTTVTTTTTSTTYSLSRKTASWRDF